VALPFGETWSAAGPGTTDLRFPGQLYDPETGLHYNYFRDYDPSTGRYMESDPIGLEGGINTYAYVEGNPVTHLDPYGLESLLGGGGIGANPENATPGEIAAATAVTLSPLIGGAAAGICLRTPACAAWAKSVIKQCANIRCKIEIHDAHHRFGPPFNSYLVHIQLTCWIKGQKQSTRIFRIPLPHSAKNGS
jgi:RHS repeat-associated protein